MRKVSWKLMRQLDNEKLIKVRLSNKEFDKYIQNGAKDK